MAKDLFSAQAAAYALYRPDYPPELIQYIASFCETTDTAWDCATGNGQAAVLLATVFKKVMATDISKTQIKNARPLPNIEYSISPAENTLFANNTFDLITVAQAYHWFNWELFQQEVLRVAKPNAVIAVWMYSLPTTNNQAVDTLLHNFHDQTVGPYWDEERKHVGDNYASVAFNYQLLPTKDFYIDCHWNRQQLLGYLSSWSATKKFEKEQGYSPLGKIEEALNTLWEAAELKSVQFPLTLKLGRVVK
jgi:SAM-dependent methyltransferase